MSVLNSTASIQIVINEIRASPKLSQLLRRICAAEIKKKPLIMPFHSMSTTIGNTIYLARDFFDWKRKEQAENLCHECIHLQQFDKMGVNAFISAYAQKAGRLRLEQEAYKTSIAWWIACGEIGSPNLYGSDTVFAASNLRIARIINALLSKYFFGSFVSEAQLIAWAAATVRELMAES